MARNPFARNFSGLPEDEIIYDLNRFFQAENHVPLPIRPTSGTSPVVQTAFAEALLFHKVIRLSEPDPETWSEMKDRRLFGPETPFLAELIDVPAVVVNIPTCNSYTAKVWRMYVFRHDGACPGWHDHKDFLAFHSLISEQFSVFLISDFTPLSGDAPLEGDSWQLAFQIARRALEDHPDAASYRKDLACNYLITGKTNINQVLPVKIDKKISLLERFPGRKFIVPEDNRNDIPVQNGDLHFVRTVEQAWRFISKIGFENVRIRLPDTVQVLNILIGHALQPAISVILLLNPDKVYLWCSTETYDKAELIRSTLSRIIPSRCEILTMDSHDLPQAYMDLDCRISLQSEQSQLICNTGGNRLMGFAALLAASTHNIPVVYRDLDAEDDCLTVLQVGKNMSFQSADVHVNNCPVKDRINWSWLYKKRTSAVTEITTEDLVKDLLLQ